MKKIALVVDVNNWAFYNIAKNISSRLSKYYEFKIIPMADIGDNIVKLFLITKDCDLIHFFWRGHITYIGNPIFNEYIRKLGGKTSDFLNEYIRNRKISTSVYDHLFLDNEKYMTEKIFSSIKYYTVSSNKLWNIYNDLDIKHKPTMEITDGVDFDKFYPINLDRFNNINKRKIIIGWVGNSKWVESTEDFKGVNTILKPAIEELINEGYNIKMFFADKQERFIPHDEMNNYYANIDLYICSSKIEGTPNPVLESMACGVPIISTDVGIVPEVFGKKQTKFILKERTKKELKKQIKYLLDNRYLFAELSSENLKSIEKWSWDEKSKQFKEFFDICLKDDDHVIDIIGE